MGKTLTDMALQLKDAFNKLESNEAVAQPTPAEQATVKLLTDHLKSRHAFWQQQGA